MGRMALFAVMGLSLTLGIVAYNLNSSKNLLTGNVIGFSKYTMSRDVAHTAVNMALRALDRNDSVFIATRSLSANFMGGSATVSFSYVTSLDTMDLTCSSNFLDTTYQMKLRLYRTPVPFPTLDAAVGLNVPNVDFKIDGASARIDGHNHDIDGNLLPPSADDKPGVAVISTGDTVDILNPSWKDQIDGSKKVIVDSGMANPGLYVDQYIAANDYYYPSGLYASNMTWGSATTPKIVYCTGDVKFTGNIEGWGIMVVHGNLTLAGTFKFHGLVVAYQDAGIEEATSLSTGTPEIDGGFLMAGGAGSDFTMKGNVKVMYSSQALQNAKYINKLQVYKVARWYE